MKTRIISNALVAALIITAGAFVQQAPCQPSFSTRNLARLPHYERYELVGKGSNVKRMPVVIEYRTRHHGKENAAWDIKGKMLLRETLVEEEYEIMLKNLLVTKYKRKMSFERGSITNRAALEIDTKTSDPQEFIVGTIPALMYILRTYPFRSNVKELHVRAPQQTKGYLNLRVKNKGKTALKTGNYGTVQAWHIEVSLMIPMLGAVLPKLNYYYRDDPQKTLVAMNGVMPATGGKLDVELRSYSKKD